MIDCFLKLNFRSCEYICHPVAKLAPARVTCMCARAHSSLLITGAHYAPRRRVPSFTTCRLSEVYTSSTVRCSQGPHVQSICLVQPRSDRWSICLVGDNPYVGYTSPLRCLSCSATCKHRNTTGLPPRRRRSFTPPSLLVYVHTYAKPATLVSDLKFEQSSVTHTHIPVA